MWKILTLEKAHVAWFSLSDRIFLNFSALQFMSRLFRPKKKLPIDGFRGLKIVKYYFLFRGDP